MIGALVCANHGGKTPLSLQAAREFQNALREPALEVIYRALRNAPPCKACGRSDADRDPVTVRTAMWLIERTVSVQPQTDGKWIDYHAWIPQERLELMTTWIAEARAAMVNGEPTPEAQQLAIEEGVLVEDENDEGQG